MNDAADFNPLRRPFSPATDCTLRMQVSPSGLPVAKISCAMHSMTQNTTDKKKPEVTVTPRAHYVPEQSDEAAGRYVFTYTISIRNSGNVAATLLMRHWIITDSQEKVQEVRGLGVVGEQPRLLPGESFQYTSGTVIATPVGTMRGSYRMATEDGFEFDAPIPEFTLTVPRVLH